MLCVMFVCILMSVCSVVSLLACLLALFLCWHLLLACLVLKPAADVVRVAILLFGTLDKCILGGMSFGRLSRKSFYMFLNSSALSVQLGFRLSTSVCPVVCPFPSDFWVFRLLSLYGVCAVGIYAASLLVSCMMCNLRSFLLL